ncbi:Signal transduction histidine kinase [Rhodovulum sp. ES.010]|uniref:sensor histidine kinase n=1 Tax=Rhodovulum sp. ES.010 TaxID=1882821 RepID=UPI000927E9C1|nr:HAMP domain-containing sensor histidine kinase [Rhodovulum sp. ES.010]SIO47721.1 Signal transduction histidine kinase [Rhodovulum sp. ES.010]
MRRLSLRLRLALAGAVAVTLAILLSSLGLAALFGAHVERRALAELSVQLDQVLAGVERAPDGTLELTTAPADPRFRQVYGGLYWQIEAGGQVLRARALWDYEIPLPADTLGDGAEHVHDLPGPAGQPLLAIERSVTLPDRLGGDAMRAAVAMDRTDLAAARAGFLRDLIPYSALLAAALILAGWAQIAVGLRPLGAIRARVADIRTGRARRVGGDVPAEVQPLAAEVDGLLAAREQEVARARTRAGDLAHGLKTPLQALMGEAGRLRAEGRGAAADAVEEIAGAMRAHVDRELARTRVAMRGRQGRADLADVVAGLVRVMRRTGEGARCDWRVDLPEGLAVAADPGDLSEALGALIENAARHARTRVEIGAQPRGGRVQIVLRDDGPGIPPDRIDALMARGARADTRGSGLGLAIARDIAEALDGTLSLRPASPGLEARLSLPAADSVLTDR